MSDQTFEATAAAERARGFYPNFALQGDGRWQCTLLCGVDVLEANRPRPMAMGQTLDESFHVARALRDRMLAKV